MARVLVDFFTAQPRGTLTLDDGARSQQAGEDHDHHAPALQIQPQALGDGLAGREYVQRPCQQCHREGG